MALIVQKYGGTSVGSIERIRAVTQRIAHTVESGHQVVVVVSAMGHETDRLVDLALQMNTPQDPDLARVPQRQGYERELDMLLATGEQVSIALVSMGLHQWGCPAVSMTGAQAGILTTKDHSRARILDIQTERIKRHLERGEVVVVAGFQGFTSAVSSDWEISTLGRGGSDTTAVALAAALQAELCEIYTDVSGVLTTDPRLVSEARLLPEITSAEMLELASLGAQVMHPRAMEIARNYGIKVKVLSSWSPLPDAGILNPTGTLILSPTVPLRARQGLELVTPVDDVVIDRDQVKIVLMQVPDQPGVAGTLFQTIAQAGVNVDLILQAVNTTDEERAMTDLAFTVPHVALDTAEKTARQVMYQLGGRDILVDPHVAKVSIAGVGMIGRPGIAADMFRVLAAAGINLHMISMSEMKVSCVLSADQAGNAGLALSEYFQVIPHSHRPQDTIPSQKPVRGVALDPKQARLAILQVPDQPGVAAHIFGKLAQAGITVDTIVQSQRGTVNVHGVATNDIAFTTSRDQAETAASLLKDIVAELGCADVVVNHEIAKVSIVGAEMEAHPGVAARMFRALADAEINIEMIATSEIKVSCVVSASDGIRALQVIHQSFGLHE